MSQSDFTRLQQLLSSRSRPNPTFYKYLADGAAKSAISNYSGLSTQYYIQPPAGEVYLVTRCIGHIEDATALDSDGYGGGSALVNGITAGVFTGSGATLTNDLFDGERVYTNQDWGKVCFDVSPIVGFPQGNQFVQFRWTFEKAGRKIWLDGDNLDRLAFTMDDNMTGLLDHSFQMQGERFKK